MRVTLIRHGNAEPGGSGVPDAKRALTPEGREKTRDAALGLKQLGVSFDRVLSSPLARARETAEIIVEVCDARLTVEIEGFLTPDGYPDDGIRWLMREHPESVAFVGHMPHVAALASALLSENYFEIEFKKAAACCIAFDGTPAAGKGCLEYFLPPRALRAMTRD